MGESKLTQYGCHFLSKVYYYRESYIRHPYRAVKTADYSSSPNLEDEANHPGFRYCIYQQLRQTVGDNPITRSYLQSILDLGAYPTSFQLSPQEQRDYLFKTHSTACNNIYTSMVCDHLDRGV